MQNKKSKSKDLSSINNTQQLLSPPIHPTGEAGNIDPLIAALRIIFQRRKNQSRSFSHESLSCGSRDITSR